jgi:hypothetical protein
MFTKFKNLFATKGKVLVTGALLIVSILAAAVGTFAWFTVNNHAVNQVKLSTDDNALNVDCYAYTQGIDVTNPNPTAYNLRNGQYIVGASKGAVDSDGNVQVNFSSDVMAAFHYSQLYDEELSMSEGNFPHVYIELRYYPPVHDGYLQANITDFQFASPTTGTINATTAFNYQYRHITVQNTTSNHYKNGVTAAYAQTGYKDSNWTSFQTTDNDIPLYNNTTDCDGLVYDQHYTLLNQCYIPAYNGTDTDGSYLYSKSTLLELRVDPLTWLKYFQTHSPSDASRLSFGITFTIGLSFSSDPWLSETKVTKLILEKGRVNTAISRTTTIAANYYNFTDTPTLTVATSDSNVATGTISGNSLNIYSTATKGTAILTVTATTSTQSAQATVAVYSYDGPTIIVSPLSVTLPSGESATIGVETVLFSDVPTISVSSSDEAIATAAMSVDGTSFTITAVGGGTATITATATYGAESATATCSATVIAGAKTLGSISVDHSAMKTDYILGQAFDTTGIIVTAEFNDGTTASVSSFTTDPENGSALNDLGTFTCTVSYNGLISTFDYQVREDTTYALVRSTSQLVIGASYVICSTKASTTNYKGDVMSNFLSTSVSYNESSRGVTSPAVDIKNDLLIATSDMEKMTLGGTAGNYTLYANSAGNSGYVSNMYGTTLSGATKTLTAESIGQTTDATSTLSQWNITLDSNYAAHIQNKNRTSYYIKYSPAGANEYYARYNCYYSTSMLWPYLYVKNTSNLGPGIVMANSALSVATGETVTDIATLSNNANIVKIETSDPGVALATFNGAAVKITGQGVGTAKIVVTAQNEISSISTIIEVSVSAATKTLQSIAITTPAEVTAYDATVTDPLSDTVLKNNKFTTGGIAITATYTDNSTAAVTTADVTNFCVFNPPDGTVLTNGPSEWISISYTFASVTKKTGYFVTVDNASTSLLLTGLEITTPPTTTRYIQGTAFDSTGLVATASFHDGTTQDVTSSCTLSIPNGGTIAEDGNVLVIASYTNGSVTKTASFYISVISSKYSLATKLSDLHTGRKCVIASSNVAGSCCALGNIQNEGSYSYTIHHDATASDTAYDETINFVSHSNRRAVPATVTGDISPLLTPSTDFEIFDISTYTYHVVEDNTDRTYYLFRSENTSIYARVPVLDEGGSTVYSGSNVVTQLAVTESGRTGYLYPCDTRSSNNFVGTSESSVTPQEATNGTYGWDVYVAEDGTADLLGITTATNRKILRFNTSATSLNPNGLFSCYRSGQLPIYLYVSPEL